MSVQSQRDDSLHTAGSPSTDHKVKEKGQETEIVQRVPKEDSDVGHLDQEASKSDDVRQKNAKKEVEVSDPNVNLFDTLKGALNIPFSHDSLPSPDFKSAETGGGNTLFSSVFDNFIAEVKQDC